MHENPPTSFSLIISIASCVSPNRDKIKTDVSLSDNWIFVEEGNDDWLPAIVPGTIHTDLFNNGVIDDPYFENNEKKQTWIENKNWIYKTNFTITKNQLENQIIELVFDGLDTYATIFLNGKRNIRNEQHVSFMESFGF